MFDDNDTKDEVEAVEGDSEADPEGSGDEPKAEEETAQWYNVSPQGAGPMGRQLRRFQYSGYLLFC